MTRTPGPNSRPDGVKVVVGVDLSLTATGLAAVTSDGMYETTSVTSTGKRGDTVAKRSDRIGRIVEDVWQFVGRWEADLVVVEGPSVMSQGGSAWDRAWLWGSLVDSVHPARVAVGPPAVLKKWAAGKGNADKAAVAVGIARLWPDFECVSDNEADALALASMGAQRLGMNLFPKRTHHSDALLKVEWPAFIRERDEFEQERRQDLAADAASKGDDQ